MPWVTPPTWTNGERLGATKLNQLSDAVNFLNGLGAINAPLTLSAEQGTYFCPRHTHRYLHIRYGANNSDWIDVYYNGVKIATDGDPDNGENWMTIDLDAVAGFVAYGQYYVLGIQTNAYSGGYTAIRFVTESSSAVLT